MQRATYHSDHAVPRLPLARGCVDQVRDSEAASTQIAKSGDKVHDIVAAATGSDVVNGGGILENSPQRTAAHPSGLRVRSGNKDIGVVAARDGCAWFAITLVIDQRFDPDVCPSQEARCSCVHHKSVVITNDVVYSRDHDSIRDIMLRSTCIPGTVSLRVTSLS